MSRNPRRKVGPYYPIIDVGQNGSVFSGEYTIGNDYHSFLRTDEGKIEAVDAPDALDTVPTAIDGGNAITEAAYMTSDGDYHGFLSIPG